VQAMKDSMATQTANMQTSMMDAMDKRIAASQAQTQSALSSVLDSMKAVTTGINDVAMSRLKAVEDSVKNVGADAANAAADAVDSYKTTMDKALGESAQSVKDLSGKIDSEVAKMKKDVKDAADASKGLDGLKDNVDKLMAEFQKTPFMDHRLPVYRWAVWSSYSQHHGWYMNNDRNMFAGVHPSQWGDGNGRAYQMSSSKDVLRTLFNKRGYGGWNTNVWAEEWYSYSSTNSRHVGVLFRIRNTKSSAVNWGTNFYYSTFGGWSEYASVARNGENMWNSGGNCGYCTVGVTISIPANRISTVIFVTSANHPSGTRTTLLGYYNNCLRLPNNLEYVDDFDYAGGGWDQ